MGGHNIVTIMGSSKTNLVYESQGLSQSHVDILLC